jgi:hypothetical protein
LFFSCTTENNPFRQATQIAIFLFSSVSSSNRVAFRTVLDMLEPTGSIIFMEVSATIIQTSAPFCDRLLVILTTWHQFLEDGHLVNLAPDL